MTDSGVNEYMTPETWGTWDMCYFSRNRDPNVGNWACLLPEGHDGPHIGPNGWSHDPADSDNVMCDKAPDSEWTRGPICDVCRDAHPGFRCATTSDKVVIAPVNAGINEGEWEPMLAEHATGRTYVPTFLAPPFPTPPKFNSEEEADAWLEAHPSG